MGKHDEDANELVPLLEEPSGDEMGDAATTLIADSAPLLFSKVTLLEQCLRLSTKPSSFSIFVQDLLLAIMRTIPCEAGSFIEMTSDEKGLFFRAAVGYRSDSVVKFLIPKGQGLVGRALEENGIIHLGSGKKDARHLKQLEDAIGFQTRNLVAVPIAVQGRPFGVFELINRHGADDFSAKDIELLNYMRFYLSRTLELRMLIATKESKVA